MDFEEVQSADPCLGGGGSDPADGLVLQEVGHHLPLPLDGNGAPAGEGVPLGLQDVGYLLSYLNNTTWVTCCPNTGSSLRPFQLKKCIISYSAKALGDIIMYYFLEFLADLLSPPSSDLGEGQVCSMLNIKNAMFCFLKIM